MLGSRIPTVMLESPGIINVYIYLWAKTFCKSHITQGKTEANLLENQLLTVLTLAIAPPPSLHFARSTVDRCRNEPQDAVSENTRQPGVEGAGRLN